jgi:phospholipid-binding lipoprotein MlaA
MRLPKHNEDFGQTLGVWGLDTGPYIVIPIWGPSNARDGVGLVADAYTYLPWWIPDWAGWSHRVAWQNSLTAIDFVNIRANLLDTTDILEQAALDRYAFVRDAFFQRRRSLVYDGNPPPQPAGSGRSQAPPAAAGTVAPALNPEESPVSAAPTQIPAPPAQVVEPRIPANYDAVLAADALRVVAATR